MIGLARLARVGFGFGLDGHHKMTRDARPLAEGVKVAGHVHPVEAVGAGHALGDPERAGREAEAPAGIALGGRHRPVEMEEPLPGA